MKIFFLQITISIFVLHKFSRCTVNKVGYSVLQDFSKFKGRLLKLRPDCKLNLFEMFTCWFLRLKFILYKVSKSKLRMQA